MSYSIRQKSVALVASVLYALSAGRAAAEDTEIFFNTAYKNTTKPNILFIMDTSGSMGSRPDGKTSGPKKIEIVQDALKQILSQTNNVNVGLSRFTVPGGPILYPVTDIDKPSSPLLTSAVGKGDDDAEEASNGAMTINSSDLDILEESAQAKWVGIRFPNLNIPQGAKISAAKVSIASASAQSGVLSVRIYGQNIGDAPAFSSTSFNISNRVKTTKYVDWSPETYAADTQYATVDLAPIIEEIVARPDWCGGNSIVLLMERTGSGSNRRSVYSFEGAVNKAGSEGPASVALAPRIRVRFDGALPATANGCFINSVTRAISVATDDVEQLSNGNMDISSNSLDFSSANYVGLRFQNLNVPKNAIVTNAAFNFKSRVDVTDTATVKVWGIKQDDFAAFPNAKNSLSAGVPLTTVSSDVTFPAWAKNQWYGQTGSIIPVLTEIFSQTNWKPGNSIGLVLLRTSGNNRSFYSYETGANNVASITIKYKATYAPGSFTVRDELKLAVDGLVASGWTPISDTLLEAGLYYRGENALFGKTRQNSAANRVSHPASYSGGSLFEPSGCDSELDPANSACAGEKINGTPVYKSPITDSCQGNHIVFLTDGEPTWHDSKTSTTYNTWSGGTCTAGNGQSSSAGKNGDDCTIKIAGFLNQKDQSGLPGTQSIRTHFIGFDISLPFLKNAATAGGGGYYEASDTAGLVESFKQIINSILQSNGTFVSAGVTVNQTNRLLHLDQLYFAMFGPTLKPRWPGNVKRYRLAGSNIVDVNNVNAINPTSDQFVETAESWWSGFKDGNEPSAGGAASKLTANRPIYTNVSGGTSNITLVAAGNLVDETNTSITEAMLGAANATERTNILKWARGQDIDDIDGDGSTTDAHQLFGDPLHSRPTLVRYKSSSADYLRVFVGTNFGTVTALDSDTGAEKWSFMPRELLTNLKVLRNNVEGVAKPYGIDGSATLYVKDDNKNGALDLNTSEQAILYIGQRRGGTAYYAIDVTKPDAPTLLFKIEKGASSFKKLGLAFSTPVMGKMKFGGVEKLVLMFGGGYDTTQDVDGAPLNDAAGNAVYIADALTGAELWSSDQLPLVAADMTNSIPAKLEVVDLNGDRLVDHIYAVDTRAQVFRFDFKPDGTFGGGRLAALQNTATQADNRRFYSDPALALAEDENGIPYLAVAIGSGYREHPLSKAINDHFYTLRDYGVFNNAFPKLIKLSDLVNITNLVGDANNDGISDAQAAIVANGAYGWRLDLLSSGEKSVSAGLIFEDVVYFSTYLPPENAANSADCSGGLGASRFYAVRLSDGNPIKDKDGSGLDAADRSTNLTNCPTCAFSDTQVIFQDDGSGKLLGTILQGTKSPGEVTPSTFARRVKWRHNIP